VVNVPVVGCWLLALYEKNNEKKTKQRKTKNYKKKQQF
jgi:hypothetical protein